MALEELHKAVDHERAELKTASLIFVVLGMLLICVFLFNPLINHLLVSSVPVTYDSFGLLILFVWIQLVCLGFRRLRWVSRVDQSLERGAVSGAMTLLDFYDEFYRLSGYLILLDASACSAFLLYWLAGASLSWWPWTDFQFATYVFLPVATFVVGIVYISFKQKWKARNKARKRIQNIMEEYLQQQSGS